VLWAEVSVLVVVHLIAFRFVDLRCTESVAELAVGCNVACLD
jgi:hypothetical protein